MIAWLAYPILALACGVLIWGLTTAIADRPPGKAQLLFAAAVELAVLAQSVIGLALLIAGRRPEETATTVGYLIGVALLIPAAWLWANVERTRYSGAVLAVAGGAVAAMTLRLLALWGTA